MENQHRYFVQYMLKNGVVPVNKALEYCQSIPEGAINDLIQLKLMIITINREISKQFFKISLITCEVANQELFVWVNTKNDEVSKLQITFSAIELEYFHVILQEMLNSEDHRLTFVVVLNITSTLTAPFSRDSGQKALNKWFKGGYFIKKADFVHLGPRLILEFTSYLKSHRPDQICKLCSELVFTGKQCGMCDKLLHSYCLEKYLSNQGRCPSCKNHWIEKTNDLVLPTTQELENIRSAYASDDSMDTSNNVDTANTQQPLPSTSSGLVADDTSQIRRSSRKRNS